MIALLAIFKTIQEIPLNSPNPTDQQAMQQLRIIWTQAQYEPHVWQDMDMQTQQALILGTQLIAVGKVIYASRLYWWLYTWYINQIHDPSVSWQMILAKYHLYEDYNMNLYFAHDYRHNYLDSQLLGGLGDGVACEQFLELCKLMPSVSPLQASQLA